MSKGLQDVSAGHAPNYSLAYPQVSFLTHTEAAHPVMHAAILKKIPDSDSVDNMLLFCRQGLGGFSGVWFGVCCLLVLPGYWLPQYHC